MQKGQAKSPAAGGGGPSPQAQMEYMQRAQMEYMQRLQFAQAQAMQAFGGCGFMGGKGMDGGYGGFPFQGKGKGKKGKGFGKGKFKGKGKGKEEGDRARDGEDGEKDGDAPEREERFSPIMNAQREARLRFEKDILDRIQGRWVDESDEKTTYTVEGNFCSVSAGDGGRGFRNRLSVYGVEMCWDARRFWHYLNLEELNKAGDPVEKVEWNPAKDSPPTTQIVWLRAPPLPEGEEEEEKKDKEEEDKEAQAA